MFENWGFLISEMVLLIVLAALAGLIAGWLIFGRGSRATGDGAEVARLKADLNNCREAGADQEARISRLEAALEDARREVMEMTEAPVEITKAMPDVAQDAVTENVGGVVGSAEGAPDAQETDSPGTRPETLDAPRGAPDDLKQIKGIGPRLERLVNDLGVYHFDQIAGWSADEVAWVDANLKGFKGRVSRDGWVDQAKVLAAGGSTAFSDKVKKGDVY